MTGAMLCCDCVGSANGDSDLGVGSMAVVVNDSAAGSWRWNVKHRRGNHLETVTGSDQTYLRHNDALKATQTYMAAEQIGNGNDNA